MDNNVKRAIDTSLHALHVSAPQKERLLTDILESKKMKKKTTFTVCIALVMLFALSGVALAAGLNLFEHFGKTDLRLKRIAPQTALEKQSPVTVNTVTLGTTTAAITNAYYDGHSLLVAYSIESSTRTERFTPTDALLQQMTKLDTPAIWAAETDEEAALIAEYTAALERGTPFGLARCTVSPSDHTYTDDGVDLPPASEMQDNGYFLREYESPLPADAQNHDCIAISIALHQENSYLWFDGKDCYTLYTSQPDTAAMTATVWNAGTQTATFSANATYNNMPVQIRAVASAVQTQITLTTAGDAFVSLPEDSWYDLVVYDEQGQKLRMQEILAITPSSLSFALGGTGTLPEALQVYLLVEKEGNWSRQEALSRTQPYLLSRIDETP